MSIRSDHVGQDSWLDPFFSFDGNDHIKQSMSWLMARCDDHHLTLYSQPRYIEPVASIKEKVAILDKIDKGVRQPP